MRKVIFLAMIVGGLVGLLRPQVASAQNFNTTSIFAVKFVCGTQAPTSTTVPAEPPVKPGNYATKINVELLSPIPAGSTSVRIAWKVSIADDGESNSANFLFLRQLQTKDITCADIVQLASASNLFGGRGGPPNFINGYVNVIVNVNTNASLAVTGVYTSQGCVFGQGEPPNCSGPVSIEVVPEQVNTFLIPTT